MKAPIGSVLLELYLCFMKSTRRFVMGVFVALILAILQTGTASADQVPVHYPEGTSHGHFIVRSLNGKEIGKGDLTETLDGHRVSAKLTLSFNNGRSTMRRLTSRKMESSAFSITAYCKRAPRSKGRSK